jgi:hypothetical protein
MPALADLIGQAAAERLAAARLEAARRQRQALEDTRTAPARSAACETCGRPYPPPPVIFRAAALSQEP